MKQIGCLISVIGFLSILLSLVGMRLKLFWFLDEAGPWVGYLLKAALIVIGIVIVRRADD